VGPLRTLTLRFGYSPNHRKILAISSRGSHKMQDSKASPGSKRPKSDLRSNPVCATNWSTANNWSVSRLFLLFLERSIFEADLRSSNGELRTARLIQRGRYRLVPGSWCQKSRLTGTAWRHQYLAKL